MRNFRDLKSLLTAAPDTVGLKERINAGKEAQAILSSPEMLEMMRQRAREMRGAEGDSLMDARIIPAMRDDAKQLYARRDSLYQERIKPALAAGWKQMGGGMWRRESPDSVDTPKGRVPRKVENFQGVGGVIPESAEHKRLIEDVMRMREEDKLPFEEQMRRQQERTRERMRQMRNP